MINQVNSNQWSNAASSTQSVKQTAVNKADQASEVKNVKTDTVQIGTKQEVSVTYTNVVAKKKLDTTDIQALKEQADRATENLRKLVEELILKQGKNQKLSDKDGSIGTIGTIQTGVSDVEQANLAISEDGEFGVKAVSDRLVEFAKSVSGGDKSKLQELISAIDEGFAQAKKALGGTLPDICSKTYDETMRKLNEWADSKDTSAVD